MNVKKVAKKIAAVATGSALMGATILGASAQTVLLSDFPEPFVGPDGVGDVNFGIGSGSTDDYLGALDIATNLQANAFEEVTVSGGVGAQTTVSDGAKIESAGNGLLLNESLKQAEERFDDDDLPFLLRDGEVVEEDENDDFEYEQRLNFTNNVTVEYDSDDTDLDDPMLYLDLDQAEGILWEAILDFTGSDLNVTELDDSETIEWLGKVLTFDPDNDKTGQITLFGSDVTAFLELNQPITVDSEGDSFTIELVGAESEDDENTIIVDVNGVRETLKESESRNVNGLDLFIDDVFVTNIPTLSASANVFIGSQEIKFPEADTGYGEIEINDETVNGLEVKVEGDNNGEVERFVARFIPSDLDNDVPGFDQTDFLLQGESITDPLFGTFDLIFEGPNFPPMDTTQSHILFQGGDDEFDLTFTNDNGDEVTFTPFVLDGGNFETDFTVNNEGWDGSIPAGTDIQDDQIFALNEGEGNTRTTILFEVQSFSVDDGQDTVTLRNLMTGDSKKYTDGDEVVDGVDIADVDEGSDEVELTEDTSSILFVNGGFHTIDLDDANNGLGGDDINISINESNDEMDEAQNANISVTLSEDSDDENDIDVVLNQSNIEDGDADDGNDVFTGLTQYGTFVEAEIDEDDWAKFWIPFDEDVEVHYDAFIAPTGANVIRSAAGSGVSQSINPFAVGIAVRDVDINLANPSRNLILMGGSCINTKSAEVQGLPAGTCGTDSGLNPGEAVIELFELDNGKVALLVAGWEATETNAAARAVATGNLPDATRADLTVRSVSDYTIV